VNNLVTAVFTLHLSLLYKKGMFDFGFKIIPVQCQTIYVNCATIVSITFHLLKEAHFYPGSLAVS
jgi:hypothetical protein